MFSEKHRPIVKLVWSIQKKIKKKLLAFRILFPEGDRSWDLMFKKCTTVIYVKKREIKEIRNYVLFKKIDQIEEIDFFRFNLKKYRKRSINLPIVY